jgi:hypothetical protein
MKNKQDRFSQRFLNRSLKKKIDNKENLYDNRPVTAAREGERIVVKSSPSYTVRVPYPTDLAYDYVSTGKRVEVKQSAIVDHIET